MLTAKKETWHRKIKKIYSHMCLESRIRRAYEAKEKFKEIANFYAVEGYDEWRHEDYKYCYEFFKKYMVK
jgi:hypothetical protein